MRCAVEDTDMRVCIVVRIGGALQNTSICRVIGVWIAITPAFVHASGVAEIRVRLVAVSDTGASFIVSEVLGRTRGAQLCAGTGYIFRVVSEWTDR